MTEDRAQAVWNEARRFYGMATAEFEAIRQELIAKTVPAPSAPTHGERP